MAFLKWISNAAVQATLSPVPITVTPKAITSMITFLDEVDAYPCLYFNQSVIADAVYRYENLLDSIAASPRHTMRVHPSLRRSTFNWVWHCHMLCPHRYAEDCNRILAAHGTHAKDRKLIDHTVLTALERRTARATTKPKWESMFPSAPFDVTDRLRHSPIIGTKQPTPLALAVSNKSQIKYNIAASAERQMTFHYQVAVMPQFLCSNFLSLGVSRYLDFLRLKHKNLDTIIVPTYDIDAAWHVHMLHPQRYAKCCHKLFGHIFKHDDSMNDRTEGSTLNTQWGITRNLWYNTYKRALPRPGAMWRGNPTAEERSLCSKIQTMVQTFVRHGSKYEGPFNIVYDPKSPLGHTSRDEYNRVPWVHTTVLRCVMERHKCLREMDKSFAEMDTPIVRRLSTLRDATGAPVLSGLVTAFVDETGSGMCDRNLNNVVEIFELDAGEIGAGKVPIATAHTAMAGSSIHPQKMQGNMVPKGVMVLRVGGVDVGLLGGYWTGFTKAAPSWQAKPIHNGVPKKQQWEITPGKLRLYFIDLSNERAKGVGKDPNMWVEILGKSKEILEPRTYSLMSPNVSKLMYGGATAEGTELSGMMKDGQVTVDLSKGVLKVEKQENLLMGYLISLSTAALFVQLQPKYEPSEKTGKQNGNGTRRRSMYPVWSTAQSDYEILRAVGGEQMDTDGNCTGAGHMLANKIGREKCFIGKTDDILPRKENVS